MYYMQSDVILWLKVSNFDPKMYIVSKDQPEAWKVYLQWRKYQKMSKIAKLIWIYQFSICNHRMHLINI